MTDIDNTTALVTGASSGLGVAFAHALARRGARLILVARREDRLQQVAEALRAQHDAEVMVMARDLAESDAPTRLFDDLTAQGRSVDILINNAGLGVYGHFHDTDWARTANMLRLDMVTLTHLTKLFGDAMVARGRGWIMQIASTGAYQPTPRYAAYAAAKSYVLNFGEALNYELRGTGVSCTVVSPGVTETEFLTVSGQRRNWYHKATMMRADAVAERGVRAMLRGKPSTVTGVINALTAFFNRLMPRRMQAAVASFVMKAE